MKIIMALLRGQGLRFALDDFGTGYSGLRTEKARIVEAVLGVAKSLGIGTIAEGVETQDVRDRLTELGCDTVQGYLMVGLIHCPISGLSGWHNLSPGSPQRTRKSSGPIPALLA